MQNAELYKLVPNSSVYSIGCNERVIQMQQADNSNMEGR